MKSIIFYVLYVISQSPDYPDTLISYHRDQEDCARSSQQLINQGLSSYCSIQKDEA